MCCDRKTESEIIEFKDRSVLWRVIFSLVIRVKRYFTRVEDEFVNLFLGFQPLMLWLFVKLRPPLAQFQMLLTYIHCNYLYHYNDHCNLIYLYLSFTSFYPTQ